MKQMKKYVWGAVAAVALPFLTQADTGYQTNVPESEYGDYTLVYEFTPTVSAPKYDIDNSKTVPSTFNRIAYYLEIQQTADSPVQYAWVSFNAFTDDITKIGVPTNYRYWDKVTAMNVYCNVDGVVSGTNIGTGNIEFWYGNYSGTPSGLGLGGSDAFDFDDVWSDGGHACMQIHNYGEKQTILSYSGWGTTGNQGGVGIGNNPAASDNDWTFANNLSSIYYTKMQVFVASTADIYPPTVASVGYDYDNAKVTVAFSEIINADDAVLDNFAFSEGYIASSISLSADGKTVVIGGERVERPVAIEVTVSGIHDVAGNEMSEPMTQKIVVDYSGYVKNVPENEYRQYSLVYEFTPQESGRPGYAYDSSSSFYSTLGRIAYYMEYRRTADSPLEYVWVSFVAPTSDIKALGIPNGTTLWQTVEDMNVYCNVEGVTTGEKITTGSIEFTDWSVNSVRSDVISGGSDDWYDFNDAVNTEGNFGSMQINNYGAEETVFTYSGFMRGDAFGSIGIGNNPNPTNNDSDWTFARNVGSTVYRKIQVFASVDQSAMTESAETATLDVRNDSGYGVVGVPSAIFTKEGDAELTLGGFVPLADDRIHFADRTISVKVNGGSLKIAEAIDTASVDVDTGAYIHLDATKTDSLVMEDGYLVEWKDARATSDMKATSVPVYDESDETTLFVSKRLPVVVEDAQNGLPAVDLGGYTYHDASGGTADTISDDSGALVFSGEGEWVRHGFMIVKHNDLAENFLFGDTQFWYFHPGFWGIISGSSADGAVRAANWHVDGVWVDNMTFALDQNWHLVSFAMYDDRRVQTIGLDRAIRAGGFQVGELILFRDQLTPERRRDIEAALMDKWFEKGYPANTEPMELENLTFADSSDKTLNAGRDMKLGGLSSVGNFTKDGAGHLTIGKVGGFSSVNVNEGVLEMGGGVDASTILAKAFVHFDPTVESSLEKNEKGEIVAVHDARGVDTIKNGHAVYLTNNLEGTTPNPVPRIGAKLVEDFSNGLPGLDTGDCWVEGSGDLPSDTGGFTMTDSCYPTKAIFMVVEKKGDRDPFIAGATWNYYPLHADSGTLLVNNGNSQDWAKSMPWYMDGTQVVPAVTPWVADGPHVIGFYYAGNDAEFNMIAAERWCRRGGLILGEILMFNVELSSGEIDAVNDYLTSRWLGGGSVMKSVTIGAGASLVSNGNFGLSDDGALAVTIPITQENPAAISIGGTFSLGENVSVTLGAEGNIGAGDYPLVSADQIENAENISTWTLGTTSGKSGRLRVVGDTVYAVISGGLAVFVK